MPDRLKFLQILVCLFIVDFSSEANIFAHSLERVAPGVNVELHPRIRQMGVVDTVNAYQFDRGWLRKTSEESCKKSQYWCVQQCGGGFVLTQDLLL